MQKFLISFPGGACGNLIAALIYCLRTSSRFRVKYNGSMHVNSDGMWKKVVPEDFVKLNEYKEDIFITHALIDKRSTLKDITVITMACCPTSKDLISKLSIGKSFTGVQQWLKDQNKPSDAEHVISCISAGIDNFIDNDALTGFIIRFEDIWNNPDKLLSQLADIVGLPVNESSINLLEEYRIRNSELYNIKLTRLTEV